jgi:Aspartyl protease
MKSTKPESNGDGNGRQDRTETITVETNPYTYTPHRAKQGTIETEATTLAASAADFDEPESGTSLPAPRSEPLEAPRASSGRPGRSRAATFVALIAALLPILHTLVHAQDHPPATRMESRARPAAPAVSGDRANIEMQDVPTVMVTVNGRGPYRFGIDTGAQGHARVSTALVTELGLWPVGEIISGDPSGQNPQTLPVYRLDTLVLGDLTFTGGTAELSLADGIDGMRGLDLFNQHIDSN